MITGTLCQWPRNWHCSKHLAIVSSLIFLQIHKAGPVWHLLYRWGDLDRWRSNNDEGQL